MGTDVDDVERLSTLGWVESDAFTPLDNFTLKSFMELPVQPWDEDFAHIDQQRYPNLKCILLSGRILPSLIPILREFDINWPSNWPTSVWEDGGMSFYVENIVERDSLL